MAIDPDLLPIHEEFDRRIGMTESQVTAVSGRTDSVAQRTTTLEETIAKLETTPGTPGGMRAPAIIVAAANSHQAIKARADIVCTGTGDAAAINRITEPVQLTDGCYQLEQPLLVKGRGQAIAGWSFGTVLMKAQQFTNAGRGSTAALVKAADTVDGNRAAAIQIRDLFLAGRFRGNFGAGGPSGTPIGGVWLEITGDDNNNPADGWPVGGPDASDNWSSLSRLRVWDTTTAVYVASTAGARGFEYSDISIARLQAGGAGLHVAASDARIDRVTASSGGAANATGILLNGGNAVMANCKAFFFNQTGSTGIHVASSRASVSGCEAQDNRVGIKVSAVHAKLTGCRVDNMNSGMDVGLDLTTATHYSVSGQMVQTRGSGTYATGIKFGTAATSGLVDAYVDASAGITTPVTTPPAGVETRIVVRRASGMTTVRRELPNG